MADPCECEIEYLPQTLRVSVGTVEVVLDAGGAGGRVLVDGRELPNVARVTVTDAVDDVPRVTVVFRPNPRGA